MEERQIAHGVGRRCFVLRTLPEACLIPMEEVRGLLAPERAEGENTLSLEELGILSRPGAPERMIILARAPRGPYLRFSAEIAMLEVHEGDALRLPARPFESSFFSALVVDQGSVVGLMLDVVRLLRAHTQTESV